MRDEHSQEDVKASRNTQSGLVAPQDIVDGQPAKQVRGPITHKVPFDDHFVADRLSRNGNCQCAVIVLSLIHI